MLQRVPAPWAETWHECAKDPKCFGALPGDLPTALRKQKHATMQGPAQAAPQVGHVFKPPSATCVTGFCQRL